MTAVFDAYAAYYDLLYREKDYQGEVDYLAGLLARHAPGASSLLELGCGTGAHALHFAMLGLATRGIDLSTTMVERARALANAQRPDVRGRMQFEVGDARTWRSDGRFDAVMSLFHVFSYQVADADIRATIATAAAHLRPDGVLIADFWHGPGVEAIGPEERHRVLEHDGVRVTRHAVPHHDVASRRVDVAYDMVVEDLARGGSERIRETHRMRYFHREELERWLREAGFEIAAYHGWLRHDAPTEHDWAAVVVARAA